jgi:hypothetical protein
VTVGRAAESGAYVATALVYDVRVALPTPGKRSDAIAVSICSWWLYSTVAVMSFGFGADNRGLRKTMRSTGVQLSGSRWSFSEPQRIKVTEASVGS